MTRNYFLDYFKYTQTTYQFQTTYFIYVSIHAACNMIKLINSELYVFRLGL